MHRSDAIATGYSASGIWCLRCDVGWLRPWYGMPAKTVCWMCERDDMVYYHFARNGRMVFDRKDGHEPQPPVSSDADSTAGPGEHQ